jgi:hypothetical protein
LIEDLLFKMELLGGVENRKQSQLRESWDTWSHCLGGNGHERWSWKGKGSDMDPLRNLNSWELGRVKGTVVGGPALPH